MTYNYEEIGNRIREERKKLHNKNGRSLSQGDLAEMLGYSGEYRQIVAKWESGKDIPTLDDALKLCSIFECELGYLLCEPNYALKDGRKTDIQKETGLSSRAVDSLIGICQYGPAATRRVLNLLLENELMWKFFTEGRPINDRIEGINLLWFIAQYLNSENDPSMFLVSLGDTTYPNSKVEIFPENYVTHGKPLKALMDRAHLESINDALKKIKQNMENSIQTNDRSKEAALNG